MAAAAGPVVVAGDEEKNPQSISLIHKAYVVVPTMLEERSEEKSNSERKISNDNWRVYFQPEKVIEYITANKTTTFLIMHVKMEMVGEQFENRDSIIYLTTDEFIEKYNHEIKIGYYGTVYPGWRRMTMAEWMNPTWQKWIVSSHIENHGWDIIGQSLMPVKNSLHVEGGLVLINKIGIMSEYETIDKYSATYGNTGESWNTKPPAQGSTWSVTRREDSDISKDASCIFVKNNNVVQQISALTGPTLTGPTVAALTAPPAPTLTAATALTAASTLTASAASPNPTTAIAPPEPTSLKEIKMTASRDVTFANRTIPIGLYVTNYREECTEPKLHFTNSTSVYLTHEMLEYCKQTYNNIKVGSPLLWNNVDVKLSVVIYKLTKPNISTLNLYFHGFFFQNDMNAVPEALIASQFIFAYKNPHGTLIADNMRPDLEKGVIGQIEIHKEPDAVGSLPNNEIKEQLRQQTPAQWVQFFKETTQEDIKIDNITEQMKSNAIDAHIMGLNANRHVSEQNRAKHVLLGKDECGQIDIKPDTTGDEIIVCIDDRTRNNPKICIVQLRVLSSNDNNTSNFSRYMDLHNVLRNNKFTDSILNMVTTEPPVSTVVPAAATAAASTDLTMPHFKIGCSDKKYNDYNIMNSEQLTNKAIAILVAEHNKNNGWPLLESPLIIKKVPLHVSNAILKYGIPSKSINHATYTTDMPAANGTITLTDNYFVNDIQVPIIPDILPIALSNECYPALFVRKNSEFNTAAVKK